MSIPLEEFVLSKTYNAINLPCSVRSGGGGLAEMHKEGIQQSTLTTDLYITKQGNAILGSKAELLVSILYNLSKPRSGQSLVYVLPSTATTVRTSSRFTMWRRSHERLFSMIIVDSSTVVQGYYLLRCRLQRHCQCDARVRYNLNGRCYVTYHTFASCSIFLHPLGKKN